MRTQSCITVCITAFLAIGSCAVAEEPRGTLTFTVSMGRPSTHYLHVVMRCQGIKAQAVDLKMPAWTPGYYKIMDYARNVVDFRAEDGQGRALASEKTSKNTWQVRSKGAESIQVTYDVYAFAQTVADSFLDDSRAFISPTGVFMYPADQLRQPVNVTIEPPAGLSRISTGLDPVEGRPNTLRAADFDVLYDCPILVGNQEVVSFEVRGIPHRVSLIEPGKFDREKLTKMLQQMVETAVSVIDDVPYRHYDFLLLGEGRGGLEHLNSMAAYTKVPNLDDPNDYQVWLGFMAHEFFHLYNVKAIRPIGLGPFDYDRENYTNLLWLSEGGTVYYEHLICNRAGFLSRDECLRQFSKYFAGYEAKPGRRLQSATQSSFDVWLYFLRPGGDTGNTTISYYDKGAALALLLDLKIRHETKNKRSLDDLMRTLYRTYYKDKGRGFTDQEFREVCETTAGCPLSEFFDVYASTTGDIDYPRCLAYGGLEIQTEPNTLPGGSLGVATREEDGTLVISSVERDSPAAKAGLSVDDEILALDSTRVTAKTLADKLEAAAPGDRVRVLCSWRDRIREVEVILGPKTEPSFKIRPMPNPDSLQAEILKDWLKDVGQSHP
jgi:predicted metalloprotease with PDZ domain